MTDAERPLRRTRRRATAPAGAPRPADDVEPSGTVEPPAVDPAPVHTAPTTASAAKTAPTRKKAGPRTSRPKNTDRGLHELAGSGSSQLDLSRALRARDVNRPGADDLAAAERDLTIVRRNWRPQ